MYALLCEGHSSPGLAKMSGMENLASTEELNQNHQETEKKAPITSVSHPVLAEAHACKYTMYSTLTAKYTILMTTYAGHVSTMHTLYHCVHVVHVTTFPFSISACVNARHLQYMQAMQIHVLVIWFTVTPTYHEG